MSDTTVVTSQEGAETTATESTTGNNQSASNSSTSEKTLNRDGAGGEKTVPYERFTEVNQEASVARELKKKLGLNDEEFEAYVKDPKSFSVKSDDTDEDTPTISKKLRDVESAVKRTSDYLAKQAEDAEWRETVASNPDVEPFREMIREMGRQPKYKKTTYSEIFNQVVKPAIDHGYKKAQSKQTEKSDAQVQTRTGVTQVSAPTEITLENFKKMSVKEKEEYLRKQGIT